MKPEVPFIQRLIGTSICSERCQSNPKTDEDLHVRLLVLNSTWILRFSCAPSSIPGSSLLQSLVVSNEIIFYIIVYLWHREQIAMIAACRRACQRVRP